MFLLHHALSFFLFAYNRIDNKPPHKWKWFCDPTLFNFWALELRLFGWWFWPIYLVLDLHNLIAASTWNDKAQGDDHITFLLNVICTYENYPTPISRLTYKLISKKKAKGMMWTYWTGWRSQVGMFYLYNWKFNTLGEG